MNPKINTLVRKFAKTEINDYVVAEGNTAFQLSASVKLFLKQGYVPYGPISSCVSETQYSRHLYLFQPMIR